MPFGSNQKYDAVVVGAGPNGLSAAVELARAQLAVLVVEAAACPGGGARTESLTLPGFLHDVCSAVHPLGVASPFFRKLALEEVGLRWAQPSAPLAHVLDDGTAVLLERSVEDTAAQLGIDAVAYRDLFTPLVERFDALLGMVLGPPRIPTDPLLYARFGVSALRSMVGLARSRFRSNAAAALLGGIAAHGMQRLDSAATSSFALVLAASAHGVGWPIAVGGSRAIVDALVARLRMQGGQIALEQPVRSLRDLPSARAYLLDLTPRQILCMGELQLTQRYRRRLEDYRYGPGVYKMDWALKEPIPWKDANCRRAATVHLSGSLERVGAALRAVHFGTVEDRPFIVLVQPSLYDRERAPEGHHTAWAYCHVPHGSTLDLASRIEAHIELYAPGFGDIVVGRAFHNTASMQVYNENYVGGDINGGASSVGQLLFRPVVSLDPYRTPDPRVFICSSSTPPGGGVHGMCGYWAARSALRHVFGRPMKDPPIM